ncbi:hypothetical protein [Pontibacter liquoris]|uniref:hypothetical protein n=1 Tax=Pontibacter liquoris TaxID=2905677 RepID=UPI001FA7C67E|nr:hypothetical protein [Pontibacter liquoris]
MIESSLFARLPSWSQAEVLMKDGILLSQRQQSDWTVTLYSFQHEFFERWEKNGMQVIGQFAKTASTLQIAEPYFDMIDMGSMLDA